MAESPDKCEQHGDREAGLFKLLPEIITQEEEEIRNEPIKIVGSIVLQKQTENVKKLNKNNVFSLDYKLPATNLMGIYNGIKTLKRRQRLEYLSQIIKEVGCRR